MALQDDSLESCKFFVTALLHSAFRTEKRRANLFSSVEEVGLVKELFWLYGAYQHAEERAVKARDETSPFRTAASKQQHGLGAALFVERAAKKPTGSRRF